MDDSELLIRILRAREPSLPEINRLIALAKRHWDWPAGYLEAALPLHRLAPDDLRRNHCFEILAAHDELVGFCSVAPSVPRVMLDNLWITPGWIGRGVGRRACEHLFRIAREKGWTELWVFPDPPAEGFYRKLGFMDTGERVPSRVPGGPLFSVYRIRLQPT